MKTNKRHPFLEQLIQNSVVHVITNVIIYMTYLVLQHFSHLFLVRFTET